MWIFTLAHTLNDHVKHLDNHAAVFFSIVWDIYTIQCVCASKHWGSVVFLLCFWQKCKEKELQINPPTSMFASWITSPPSPLPLPLPFLSFTCIECSNLDWRWWVQMWGFIQSIHAWDLFLVKFVHICCITMFMYTPVHNTIHNPLSMTLQLQINHTLHNYIPDKTFPCGICPRRTYTELSTN